MFTVYCPHRLHNNVIDISFSFGVSSPPRLLKDCSKLERVPIINIRYAPDHFQISKLFPLKVSLIFQCHPFYLEGKTLCAAFTVWFDAIEKILQLLSTLFVSSLLFLQKVARKWQFVVSMLECPARKKYCRLLLCLQLSNTPYLDKSLNKSKPFVHFSP